MPSGQKRQKILFLFYEPFKSGISRHVRYIIEVLQSCNYDFWIICSNSDIKIQAYFQEVIPIENIITVPSHRFFSFRGLLATRKSIRRHDIDIVHIHNLQSILWGYGGAILAGCRSIIFTPHIDTACAEKGQWIFRLMWRLFNPFTSSLIALSRSQKEWFIEWKIAHEEKITVINNHISEKFLREAAHPDTGTHSLQNLGRIRPNAFIVTQIGRLDRQKDPFFLIRVAQLARNTSPDIHFLLVGEGPLRKKIESTIVSSSLQDNVILTGHRNDISTVFQISDVISLTSRWEGFPYVLLEAVCFQKALLATDIPGNREIIFHGKNGFLVQNEEDFLEKLIILKNSPQLRKQMGTTGYRMNRHLLDIHNMKEAVTGVYEGCSK